MSGAGPTIPNFTIPLEQHRKLVVQDHYEYTDVVPTFAELIQVKSSAVDALIAVARHDENPRAWYLNWCNACTLPLFIRSRSNPIRHCYRPKRGRWKAARVCTRGQLIFVQKELFLNPSKVGTERSCLTLQRQPDPDLAAADQQFQLVNKRAICTMP